MELGDLFLQRAARERHPERALLEHHLVRRFRWGFLFETLGAGILALGVAPDAVVGLVERADEVGTRIGEGEALAPADVLGSDGIGDDALAVALVCVHEEILRIDLRRRLEEHPRFHVFATGGPLPAPRPASLPAAAGDPWFPLSGPPLGGLFSPQPPNRRPRHRSFFQPR